MTATWALTSIPTALGARIQDSLGTIRRLVGSKAAWRAGRGIGDEIELRSQSHSLSIEMDEESGLLRAVLCPASRPDLPVLVIEDTTFGTSMPEDPGAATASIIRAASLWHDGLRSAVQGFQGDSMDADGPTDDPVLALLRRNARDVHMLASAAVNSIADDGDDAERTVHVSHPAGTVAGGFSIGDSRGTVLRRMEWELIPAVSFAYLSTSPLAIRVSPLKWSPMPVLRMDAVEVMRILSTSGAA